VAVLTVRLNEIDEARYALVQRCAAEALASHIDEDPILFEKTVAVLKDAFRREPSMSRKCMNAVWLSDWWEELVATVGNEIERLSREGTSGKA
jgi:hypothetical protein